MHNEFDFYCITGGYDLNETEPLSAIQLNQWNDIIIDEQAKIKVWYDDKKRLDLFKMKWLFKQVNPNTIYINGFMHIAFLLNPLLVVKYSKFRDIKVIVAPRGMLQSGALSIKSLKKIGYLKLIQLLGLTKNIHWHITTPIEKDGIRKYFSVSSSQITCIANIPCNPIECINGSSKLEGLLSLVYASIITEKKNLLYVLQSLMHCKVNIDFAIYGVIKEEAYWHDCEIAIKVLPKHIKVSYKGSFKPDQMQQIVANYDAMILLSKGENFSHAIFEALGAGRPIISSDFTSWDNLAEKKAGWNLPLEQPALVAKKLDQLAAINNNEWMNYCSGAHQLAEAYLAKQDFGNEYVGMLDGSKHSA